MFNILLEWQSAVALSPLAKLWNGPFASAEYINLSVLQNLQIKQRGRRLENENVNLTGKSIWGSFALRSEEIYTSASLLCLWPLSFGSYLTGLNKQQCEVWAANMFSVKHLVNSSRLHLLSLSQARLWMKKGKTEKQRERGDWAWILVTEIFLNLWLHYRT